METLQSLVHAPRAQQEAGGFVYTPKEIAQQPASWRGTLDIFIRDQVSICSFLDGIGLRERMEERPVVLLIGAGTSDYIGQALELLIRQKWGCEVWTVASTDLLPNLSEYVVPGRKYLWI